MEVSVKLGIGSLSQMARDRFMALFQAMPGKCSLTGLRDSHVLGKPGGMEGAFWGALQSLTASPTAEDPSRVQGGVA